MARPWLLSGLVVLMVAGCFGDSSERPLDSLVDHDHGDAWADEVLFEGLNCIEGGGHSVHPKLPNYLPKPWLPADVMDDTGRPPVLTEPYAHPTQVTPQTNNTMGNWHVGVACQTTTSQGRELVNHIFGYVGMRVEAPPFDEGQPADRHYLVTVIASNDAQVREMLHHHGIHATDTTGHTGIQTNGLFHSLLTTGDHGTYESYFQPVAAGSMPESFRLWFQKENADGTFAPVSLDVQNEGGQRLRANPYGTFTHMDTTDHWPLPGAGGESPAVAYTGFSRTIKFGPAPNVTLEKAYIHV